MTQAESDELPPVEHNSFDSQLAYFLKQRCPECGGVPAKFGAEAWPYCLKHGSLNVTKHVP